MENADPALAKLANYEFLLWKVIDRLKKKRAAKLNEVTMSVIIISIDVINIGDYLEC